MYRPEVVKARIRQMCANRNITTEKLVKDCGLGINAVRQIGGARGMSAKSIAAIAEYLGCTMEYIMGITDEENCEIDAFVHEFLTRPAFAEFVKSAIGKDDGYIKTAVTVLETMSDENLY